MLGLLFLKLVNSLNFKYFYKKYYFSNFANSRIIFVCKEECGILYE